MSLLVEVLAIAAFFGSHALATDCDSNPGAGIVAEDEISLMQVRKTLELGVERSKKLDAAALMEANMLNTTNASGGLSPEDQAVQDALNAKKAAETNATIAKYAAARANCDKAQALYDAAKKASDSDRANANKVHAMEAAKKALQCSQDEADAWKAAVKAGKEAAAKATEAEANAKAKAEAAKNATSDAKAATKARETVQKAADNIKIVQQANVNKVAAQVAADKAAAAKLDAANKTATTKAAMEEAEKACKQAKLEWHLAHKSMRQAQTHEIEAARASDRALHTAMQAAAAEVDAGLANASNFTGNFSSLPASIKNALPANVIAHISAS